MEGKNQGGKEVKGEEVEGEENGRSLGEVEVEVDGWGMRWQKYRECEVELEKDEGVDRDGRG